WAYSAMSRPRDSATFGVTDAARYPNVDGRPRSTREELVDVATRTLETERRQELALEAMHCDPGLSWMVGDRYSQWRHRPPPEPTCGPLEPPNWIGPGDGLEPDLGDELDFGP